MPNNKVATDTDALSRAIEKILAEFEIPKANKNKALSILAKEVAGRKHNWGYLTSGMFALQKLKSEEKEIQKIKALFRKKEIKNNRCLADSILTNIRESSKNLDSLDLTELVDMVLTGAWRTIYYPGSRAENPGPEFIYGNEKTLIFDDGTIIYEKSALERLSRLDITIKTHEQHGKQCRFFHVEDMSRTKNDFDRLRYRAFELKSWASDAFMTKWVDANGHCNKVQYLHCLGGVPKDIVRKAAEELLIQHKDRVINGFGTIVALDIKSFIKDAGDTIFKRVVDEFISEQEEILRRHLRNIARKVVEETNGDLEAPASHCNEDGLAERTLEHYRIALPKMPAHIRVELVAPAWGAKEGKDTEMMRAFNDRSRKVMKSLIT